MGSQFGLKQQTANHKSGNCTRQSHNDYHRQHEVASACSPCSQYAGNFKLEVACRNIPCRASADTAYFHTPTRRCLSAKPTTQEAPWSSRMRRQSTSSLQGPPTWSAKFIRFQLGVALRSPVDGSKCGRRCRGQCTILNSCGVEYRKLNIWGPKNSSKVSEKCPNIPATAPQANWIFENPSSSYEYSQRYSSIGLRRLVHDHALL